MQLSRLRSLPLLALAPLALAACSETEGADGGPASGEPIPAIAAPAGAAWADTVTITPEGGYMIGNPDAPLKLVEYASHTCGACASFAATGKAALKDKYVPTGVVSFELRNLVRDPIDLSIAALVRCGAKENMQPLSDQAWPRSTTFSQRSTPTKACMRRQPPSRLSSALSPSLRRPALLTSSPRAGCRRINRAPASAM